MRNEQYRENAKNKLAYAKSRAAQAQKDLVSATRRIKKWSAEVEYYTEHSTMTDEQLDAYRKKRDERQAARAQRTKRRALLMT